MMTTQTSKKQFTIYVVAAFALGWILQIVASIYANKGDNTVFRIIITQSKVVMSSFIIITLNFLGSWKSIF